MNLRLQIEKKSLTSERFPVCDIRGGDGSKLATLDIQATKFGFRTLPSDIAADFLLIASTVYTVDKLVYRGRAEDAWTRSFKVSIPVSAPKNWQRAEGVLSECVSFLTGDRWQFEFSQLSRQLFGPYSLAHQLLPGFNPAAVSLFSGGLDSLVGIIDWLESNPGRKLLLAGHHDKQMKGTLTDQERLLAPLKAAYPDRLQASLVRVGNFGKSPEITLRGRSLLFLAVAVCVASGYKIQGPILLPENGTIALNIPLSPSRRGSCSTRTAHPHYLSRLREVFCLVGIENNIVNPLLMKTKGEVVRSCLNPELLKGIVTLSVSCAKRGHKRDWKRHASGCGRCMPCIYRRAALHSAGLDFEPYGLDFCKGEVDPDSRNERGPADLRACASFLRHHYGPNQIKSLLLSNGHLDLARMDDYAALVTRAFDEIRGLLRDKARKDLRRMAGNVSQ